MLHYRTRLPGMSSAESLGPHASSCWACRRPWLSDLAGPEGLPMTWLAHSVQMTARALIGSASQHSGNNCGAPSLNEYKPVGLGSSGMYPRFAIITEETQPSAAPETLAGNRLAEEKGWQAPAMPDNPPPLPAVADKK